MARPARPFARPDIHTLLAVAKAELRHLSERLEEAKASQDDLRRERDDWKEQAQRLALAAPIAAPGPVATPEAAAPTNGSQADPLLGSPRGPECRARAEATVVAPLLVRPEGRGLK